KIQVLDDDVRAAARPATPPPAGPPARLKVTIEPSPAGGSLFEQAEYHRGVARRHQRMRRVQDARQELAEAARLYRRVAERGGAAAGAARQGLEECQRALAGLR